MGLARLAHCRLLGHNSLHSLRSVQPAAKCLSIYRLCTATTIGKHQTRLLSSVDIRTRFTNYFVDKGYTKHESSSLIPQGDNSLMFTNAGMVQFKEYFLNPELAPMSKVVTVQKCVRAGGKHNDLDNVGHTPRHHTFFEMLGNFQFAGGATKEETIRNAWQFLTKELNLPADRLRVSVLDTDQESYGIWRNQEKIPADQIVRCGPKDNFWSMGEEGPCGPCTEIFWDTKTGATDDDRWLEIWNLVFMQYHRTIDGKLTKLPSLCVDTGMGLERIASVLQNKASNFEIDSFQALRNGIFNILKEKNLPIAANNPTFDASINIIADHFRASCFLAADGVLPSHIGRGYVLRRIIRRSLLAARHLGLDNTPFLTSLYPTLINTLGSHHPKVTSRQAAVSDIILAEEELFIGALENGSKALEKQLANLANTVSNEAGKRIVPSEVVFLMQDSFGFSADLTDIAARERGWEVDVQGVEALLEEQKARGRASWKKESINTPSLQDWQKDRIFPKFTGYNEDEYSPGEDSVIVAVDSDNTDPSIAIVSIDPCPFYGHGGGQVPDVGKIEVKGNGSIWEVMDVFLPYQGGLALKIRCCTDGVAKDCLKVGAEILATVCYSHRQLVSTHHTATHLLNAALRVVLKKDSVAQAGSHVDSERLRYDFAHGKPLTGEQIQALEDWVNAKCRIGATVRTKHLPLNEAISKGAVANFSEKYGDIVRVIEASEDSVELCGGTHVGNISDIFPFKILAQTSVAAGIRRLEAVAGIAGIEWLFRQSGTVAKVANLLKVIPAEMDAGVVKLLDQNRRFKKDVAAAVDIFARMPVPESRVRTIHIKGHGDVSIAVEIHLLDSSFSDASLLQRRVKFLAQSDPSNVYVVLHGDTVAVGLSKKNPNNLNASKILQSLLLHTGGSGGGSAEFARAYLPVASSNDKNGVKEEFIRACEKIELIA